MYSLSYADTPVLDTEPTEADSKVTAWQLEDDEYGTDDDKLPESADFHAETPDEKRRADWRANHLLIERSIMYLMRRNGRPATNRDIAESTGLSERAVRYHLENVDLDKLFSSVVKSYAPLADEIMMSIVHSAKNGTSRAQELYFEIVFGWKRGQKIEIEKPQLRAEEIERLAKDALRRSRNRHREEIVELRCLSKEELYQRIHSSLEAANVALIA